MDSYVSVNSHTVSCHFISSSSPSDCSLILMVQCALDIDTIEVMGVYSGGLGVGIPDFGSGLGGLHELLLYPGLLLSNS